MSSVHKTKRIDKVSDSLSCTRMFLLPDSKRGTSSRRPISENVRYQKSSDIARSWGRTPLSEPPWGLVSATEGGE